jgi:parallel beta-helix repeat protein
VSLAACKSGPSNGYAVDLTIVAGPLLAPAAVRSIDALDIVVGGAETFKASYPITTQLVGDQARWIYRPRVPSGTLTFAVTGRSASGTVAFGQASVTLKPGDTATGTVTLGATQASVDMGVSDGGGAVSDLAGADLAGTCSAASCAAMHKDCDQVTGTCVPCAAPPAPENRSAFWVGANSGSITGSEGCPYPTITAALASASATTATFPVVHVTAGSYTTASGETFPLIVRKSISVTGAGAQSTVVSGQGNWSGAMFGSQANGMFPTTMVVGSPGGTVSISGLTLKPTVIAPTATYVGIFCDAGNLPNLPLPAPNTTLSGLIIGPNYDTAIMVTNSLMPVESACNIKVLASTLTGNQVGVNLFADGSGASNASSKPVGVMLGDGTTANANTISSNHKIGSGSTVGAGVYSITGNGIAAFLASQNTFTANDYGANFNHYLRVPLDFESNVFTGNGFAGIYVQNDEYLVLNGNSFSGNISSTGGASAGVFADGGSHVKARSNSFVGNDIGVNITGNGMLATGANARTEVDFGKSGDLGNNTFSCNSLVPHGYDLYINLFSSDPTPITLEGSSWDHMPPQTDSSTAAAAGTDIVNAPITGTAATLDFANSKPPQTATCPNGKMH